MENNHSKAIPAEILVEAQSTVNGTATAIAPYIISLTPAQRHAMAKMGEKTFAFVNKAFELAEQNPDIRPGYLNMDDFAVDMEDATKLLVLRNSLEQLLQGIDDTMMLAGSEAYQSSLSFYHASKDAARRNVPGAKAVYDELRIRFPRVRRRNEEE